MGTFQLFLLGLMFLVTAQHPRDFTPAQWFKKQHVQYPKTKVRNNDIYCNNEMRKVNNYTHQCKAFNTFLNYKYEDIISVCSKPNITCKNGKHNCHKSTSSIPITSCDLTSGCYSNCHYHGTSQVAYFVVACNPPLPADYSKSKFLPVHLDSTTGF
ncbi:ribonuclease K3-like [Dromiciops gliroides]|uniref:ribonuclease K3-like n=1 Tax=Dromiciops gliroides TaxID=33562 RepID=UPI001CC5FC61|nr:ribonuclease K3-like [Dromiciops gliroides]